MIVYVKEMVNRIPEKYVRTPSSNFSRHPSHSVLFAAVSLSHIRKDGS